MGAAGSIRRHVAQLSTKDPTCVSVDRRGVNVHDLECPARAQDSPQAELEQVNPHEEPVGEDSRFGAQDTVSIPQSSKYAAEEAKMTMPTNSNANSAIFPPELDEDEVHRLDMLPLFCSWRDDPDLEGDYSTSNPPPCFPAVRRQHMEEVKKLDEYLTNLSDAQACIPMDKLSRKQQLLVISSDFLQLKLWQASKLVTSDKSLL
eukprot:TRINITY_DN8852_c0_g2_i1.p1 TRINITY_DN8852_c0_g2~~TRINITY_DN8852_c0_g2_i1.p1  ORF type:complete len:204 (-),score=39.92 TRINITY_DN8852_c0_g2_i1:215-826(-)